MLRAVNEEIVSWVICKPNATNYCRWSNSTKRSVVVGSSKESANHFSSRFHETLREITSRDLSNLVQIQPAFPGMFIALTQSGGENHACTVAIVSIVLVFAFAFTATAQDTSSPDDTISNLNQQLMEIEWSETELRIRLEELKEELKPENIEIALETSPSKPMTQLMMLPDFGVQHVSLRTMFVTGSALILGSVLLLLRQLALTMPNRPNRNRRRRKAKL
jgi:hypothetical protein